jgi:predicted regulator of Ras-like GTPase activity (Roadblock/LC7/MglB family)
MLELLKGLRATNPEIESAVLVTSDALPLGSDIDGPLDEEDMSVFVSSLIAATERALDDLDRGNLRRIYVMGETGYIIVFQVNDDISLACTIAEGAPMELALRGVSMCASRLSRVF